MSVRNLLGIIAISFIFTGCWWNSVEPVNIKTEEVKRTKLNIKEPSPLEMRNVEFVIITKDNRDEVFKHLNEKGDDEVLIGLTDNNYENLSINLLKIRNHISEQKKIIDLYKNYYEKNEKKD